MLSQSSLQQAIISELLKQNKMRSYVKIVLLACVFFVGCVGKTSKMENKNEVESIFPKGELGKAENFTGNAWNTGLVGNDSVYNTLVGNVYFEPGARSNWHTHPSGQILIITDGMGYHQLKGQPVQIIRKGDVVKCPPNVEHWHGASPATGMRSEE